MSGIPSSVGYILVIEDQKGRRTIPLEDLRYSIGRKSSNSIVINSRQASRNHATLVRKTNTQNNKLSYWILDGDLEGNKSHNGLFVNGQKCLVHELKDGDLINFGCEVNASYHVLANISDAALVQPAQQLTSDAYLTSTNTSNHETIEEQAYQDPLTELPNRSLFNEYLSMAIGNAQRNRTLLGILFIDIEELKHINDSLGYTVGNRLLKEFSQRVKKCLRGFDIVSRWAGDEFAILLPQIRDVEDPSKISQRIIENLKQPFELETQQIYLKSVIGVAVYPSDGDEGKTLLNKAEVDLNNNKRQEPSQTRLQNQSSQSSRIEYVLQQALEKKEFALYYQPQVNIVTGDVDGMECLIRWQHPQHGAIPPSKFIPVAEKTEMIVPLTRWIFEKACQQNQKWQKEGLLSLPIGVNLSPRQFHNPHLLEIIRQVLTETGLAANLLELDITEKAILDDFEGARRILSNLEELGVRLAMDDFGMGYSSINYLYELPFQKIKIAQSVIDELKNSPQKISLISALITLGRSLNLKVVAEGVETQQQLELLRRLHCEQMQGYRLSQPLDSEEATKFLSLHQTMLGT
jgi:diguanylate cyclase (GGDEF)-like protein